MPDSPPFELGLDLGCRLFAGDHLSTKRILVLEREQYRYQKVISDISGNDIEAHDNDAEILVRKVRNWACASLNCDLPPGKRIWYRFTDFLADTQLALVKEGYSLDDINDMPVAEFIRRIKAWRDSNRLESTSAD